MFMLTHDQLIDKNRRLRELAAEQQVQMPEAAKLQAAVVKRSWRRMTARSVAKLAPQAGRRQLGREYGMRAERSVSQQVDRTVRVECQPSCPQYSAQVCLEGRASQFKIDLPEIRPQTTESILQQGRCLRCGRPVRGRHAEQICDATSVSRVHFGPSVNGLAAHRNKICGPSSAKYRGSAVVTADETGWKVAGLRAWLWGFASAQETVPQIERGHGVAEVCKILGEDFCGVQIADGNRWALGAKTQAILTTLFRTMHQKSLKLRKVIAEILCAPTPVPNLTVID